MICVAQCLDQSLSALIKQWDDYELPNDLLKYVGSFCVNNHDLSDGHESRVVLEILTTTLLKPHKLVGTAKGQVVTTNDLFSVTL